MAVLPAMLLAGALGATPAAAQGGWLGLSLDFEDDTAPSLQDRQTVIIIGVADDSPAQRAGVRENDILLEIDGEAASRNALENLVRNVGPGDAVEVVLLRGDERIPLVVEAGEPPDRSRRAQSFLRPARDSDRIELRVRLDSIRGAVEVLNRQNLDRVRTRMDSLTDELERGAIEIEEFQEALERSAIVRGDALEELSERLSILRDSIGTIEIVRGRMLQDWDSDTFNRAIRGVVIPELEIWMPDFDGGRDSDWNDAVIAWGGVSPFLIGQRVVAGAELVDLNESLAGYFDVEGGALVVDVSERSPAGEAGIQPGDVIVEVGGEPVDGVAEVRERFARLTFSPVLGADPDSADAVTITVVRESRRVEIELRE